MSLYYRILYRLGIRPWEEDSTQGPAPTKYQHCLDGRRRTDGRLAILQAAS